MPIVPPVFVWSVAAALLAGAGAGWHGAERRHGPGAWIFRTASGYFCPVVVPARPTEEERRSARLLAETLAHAAGRPASAVPVIREGRWLAPAGGIFVGETRRGAAWHAGGGGLLDRTVAWRETASALLLRATHRGDIEAAASLWLERRLGARWFLPGPLGVQVARRAALDFSPGEARATPSLPSRDLSSGDREWFGANRLRSVFAHGHGIGSVIRSVDARRELELAPWIDGRKFLPADGDGNWQPNIASPRAVALAVERGSECFRRSPAALTFVIGMNDSIRYDQSPATVAAAGPLRYFRGRPDYSNLVFGFANGVARGLATEFPDRFVATYAYDWTEQTPTFAVEPNVTPWLTADRLLYFDRMFAGEDKDLMTRWAQLGPRVVGIYDYYEGAPYFVPRLDPAAIAESIQHAHRAGIRAFYAEGAPNWGLDGPKLWLAAQLLWDATQNPTALLDTYYRECWREAAGPMRQFYTCAEQAWKSQPLPTYWLKYYKDEHQHRLFPEDVRREMRTRLAQARAGAATDIIRRRIDLVAAGFAVTETWCAFCEVRDALSALALAPALEPAATVAALARYAERRTALLEMLTWQRREHPLAVAALPVEEYLRNDPRGRVVARVARERPALLAAPAVRAAGGDLWKLADLSALAAPGRLASSDAHLRSVRLKSAFDATTTDYVAAGAWRGHGEPFETRTIGLRSRPDGGQAIRFTGCKQETLSQWLPGEANALCIATARVRAKVSPGNRTFLLVSFLDKKGGYLGFGATDRLPVGDWSATEHELCVVVRTPPGTTQIGLGVRALDQVNDDFAEFAEISLRRLEPAG